MQTVKPWYASRVIWANIITVIVAIFMFIGTQPVIPVSWGPYILIIIGALNIVLRFITTQPIV